MKYAILFPIFLPYLIFRIGDVRCFIQLFIRDVSSDKATIANARGAAVSTNHVAADSEVPVLTMFPERVGIGITESTAANHLPLFKRVVSPLHIFYIHTVSCLLHYGFGYIAAVIGSTGKKHTGQEDCKQERLSVQKYVIHHSVVYSQM